MSAHARKRPKAHNLNTEKHIFTKRRFFFIAVFLLLCSALPSWAVTAAYYSSIDNKSGSALVSALTTVARTNYSGVSYGSGTCTNCVWGAFGTTDVYPSNPSHPDYVSGREGKIWEIYAGCVYTFQTDQGSSCSTVCGTSSGCGYNREHSLPKSWFGGGTSVGPGTDIFHIYPTDVNVNTKRGNNPFGVVSSPTYTSPNGSKIGPCSWPSGYTGTVFEPADYLKGDLARGYFYMLIAWNAYNSSTYSFTQDTDGEGAVIFNNTITSAGNYGLTSFGLQLLLKWHREDPVSQKEIDRNNAVQAIQGNRNPFIDYPCLVEYIWGNKKDTKVTLSSLLGSFESGFTQGSSDGCSCGPQVTITFNANGGTGTMDPQSVPSGVSTPLNTCTFTREGYTFSGWAKTANGTKIYDDGDNVNIDANLTLYAKWTALPSYTVTFLNGTATHATRTGYTGQSITVSEPSACEGYTFVGWSTHEYGAANTTTPVIDFDGTIPSAATTYHAVFSRTEGDATTILTNNYKKITTLSELTNGNYIIAGFYNNGYYALSTTWKDTYYLAPTTVTPNADVITTTDGTIIWQITVSNNQATLHNATAGYLYIEKSGTYYNIKLGNNTTDNKFTYSVSAGNWLFTSVTYSTRVLEYYTSRTRWAYYTAADAPVYLYKQQEETTGTTYYTTSTVCQCTVTVVSANSAQGTVSITTNN